MVPAACLGGARRRRAAALLLLLFSAAGTGRWAAAAPAPGPAATPGRGTGLAGGPGTGREPAGGRQPSRAQLQEWQRRSDAIAAVYGRGDVAAALRLQQELVVWVRTHIGPSSAVLGVSLGNLAVFHNALGQTRQALASIGEAVTLLRRQAAADPAFRQELAKALKDQASFHSDLGETNQALPAAEEAVALARELAAADPSAQGPLAAALIDLGTLLDELGRLQEAHARTGEAVRLLRVLVGAQPDLGENLALALMNLGAIATRLGLEQEALTATREAVVIHRRRAAADPFQRTILAQALINLGSILSGLGLSREALAANQEALGVLRPLARSSPSVRVDLAEGLNALSSRFSDLGQLAESLRSAEEAVALLRELTAANPALRERLARALTHLAGVLDSLGREAEALAVTEEAVAILADPALRNSHADSTLATALSNLGALQLTNGQLDAAIATLIRAVDVHNTLIRTRPSLLGGLAAAFSNLGIAYARADKPQEALTSATLAVKIRRDLAAANPARRDDLAGALNNLANRLSIVGRDAEALQALQEALSIQRPLARRNPAALTDLGLLTMNAADVQLRSGARDAALPLLEEMVRSDLAVLQRQLPLLPERRRQALVQSQGRRWQLPFSQAQQGAAGARLALLTRLNRQGLLQEIQRRQATLARSSPLRALSEQLSSLSSQLANTALPPGQRQLLEARREQLEQELYRQLPELQAPLVEPEQVAALLPAAGRLVEFQRYRPHDPRQPRWERSFGPPRYLALVLQPDGRIASVDLGLAVPIEAAVGRALSASAANLADAPELWAAVGRLVMEPLAAELAGAAELFLSPDGELNRVPFAAVPAPGAGGRLLGEAVRLRLLTTGRDLVRLRQPGPVGQPALVMADPRFDGGMGLGDGVRVEDASEDASEASAAAGSRPASGSPATRSRGSGKPGPAAPLAQPQRRSASLAAAQRWPPLPGTAAEARQVAPLLGAGAPITGRQATASRLLQVRGPRVVHIATHGFFAPDQPEAPAADGRESAAPGPWQGSAISSGASVAATSTSPGGGPPGRSSSSDTSTAPPEDPLLRSGLALAGANRPDADPSDDGYLTAAEVTGMDLDGTQLVTLSACETGLGDLRSGEGVYGLQRALTVAGSRSTLLSLWKVDDAATAAFMVDFYTRLRSGQPRAEALAASQAAFRVHPNPLFRDLYVWGAFQLTGDWRALPPR